MRLNIFPPTLFSLIFLATPALVYSFVLQHRLVRAEYESNRVAWEADGKPMNSFFIPPGQSWLDIVRGSWAWNRVWYVWLFKTPQWVSASIEYRLWLRRLRICVLVWNLWSLLVVAFVFLLWAAQG
jgi:hypothetical protein